MAIRTIHAQEGLDALWDELVYTEALVEAEPLAQAFASVITALVTRAELAQAAQRKAWRAEIVAQALVDKSDDTLDDRVSLFSLDLSHAESGNKQSPRYKLYFSDSMTSIIKLGLESELKKVANWPAALAGEPEAALQAHGVAFAALATAGHAALDARTAAASARATQRVRDILTLFDDVNAARLSLHGQLSQVAAANRLSKDWADRFFRHLQKTPKAAAEPTAASTATTK